MNATVARIVELLFEDVEMTDEVQAIRDEVMNNCQERFEDLLSSGMSEDDAIGAVVESLKGMEEVLEQYPRKPQEDAAEGIHKLVYSADAVKAIEVHAAFQEVMIEPSYDDMIHVEFGEDAPFMVEHSGGRLDINYVERMRRTGSRKGVRFTHGRGRFGASINVDSFGELWEAIASMKFSSGADFDDELRILIPGNAVKDVSVYTASGDITVGEVQVDRLCLSSASGDVKAKLCDEYLADRVEIKTTSGDAEAMLMARHGSIQTMSGDVTLEGRIQEAKVQSVSGDLNVRADLRRVSFRSVSGDVEISCDSDEINEIIGNTTSGDVRIRMPMGVRADLEAHSVSGDVRNKAGSRDGKNVRAEIRTITGDITIR